MNLVSVIIYIYFVVVVVVGEFNIKHGTLK